MSRDDSDFISLALAGKVMVDEVDDYVDAWHSSTSDLPLSDYLGLQENEFFLWLSLPETLPLIIASRKTRVPLEAIANDNLQLRLAARTDDSLNIKRIRAWINARKL